MQQPPTLLSTINTPLQAGGGPKGGGGRTQKPWLCACLVPVPAGTASWACWVAVGTGSGEVLVYTVNTGGWAQ